MDNKLVPLMGMFLALFLGWVAYAGFSYWRTRRAIAWNVVQAALTRRHLSAEQAIAVDGAVRQLVMSLGMKPETFASAPAVVKCALDAMAMHRLGVPPVGAARPFSPMRSPHLARSVGQHIRVVRFQVENRHAVRLTELDGPPAPST